MKKLALVLKLALIVFVIVIYIFSINIFASLINFSSQQQSISSFISGGFYVKMGVSDSVSILVTRPRFYGTIYETNNRADLYLFNLIKLPLKVHSYTFFIFHLIFLITLILFTILIFTKKKVYKEETTTPNYETHMENTLNNY